jgi:hypothetical protein
MANNLDNLIDEKFLEKNITISNALYGAGIKTYNDLFARAKQKCNLYYIPQLGIGSINIINQHVIGKFKRSLPNYKKNIHY